MLEELQLKPGDPCSHDPTFPIKDIYVSDSARDHVFSFWTSADPCDLDPDVLLAECDVVFGLLRQLVVVLGMRCRLFPARHFMVDDLDPFKDTKISGERGEDGPRTKCGRRIREERGK